MAFDPTTYQFILSFGEHKGKTYGYVAESHPAHLEWIAANTAMPKLFRVAAKKTMLGMAIDNLDLPKYAAVRPSSPDEQPQLWCPDKSSRVALRFMKNDDLRERLKIKVDGFRWNDGKFHWDFPPEQIVKVVDMFGGLANIRISDAALALYDQEINRRAVLDEIRTKTDTDLLIATKMPLFNYQKVAVEFGLHADGRFIIGDSMGLGKTAAAIGFAVHARAKTLIVCPKSVKRTTWKREISRFAGQEACIWDGTGPEGDLTRQFHVIHYDIVHKFLGDLMTQQFDLLVCDEATMLKNPTSIRTKSVLGRWTERRKYPGIKTKWAIMLSGTPLLNRPSELYGLLHFLHPKRFSDVRNFLERYGGGRFDPAPRNLGELHDRIKDIMIRRLAKDIRGDVAIKQHFDLFVEMTPEERKQYHAFERALFTKWRMRGSPSASQMPEIRNYLFGLKFPRIVEFVDEMIESGRNVLVFSIQQEHAERIANHYGPRARLYHGGVSDKLADKAIEDLREGKANVASFTIGKGSMGIDGLQHHFDAVLFVDEWFVPGINEQAEDRVNRTGQKNPVHVWYMQVKDTYDELTREMVAEKRKIIDSVVDGTPSNTVRQSSVFGDIVKKWAVLRNVDIKNVDEVDDVNLSD